MQVADEVLYQARIHPETRTGSLGAKQIERIHSSLDSVVSTACACNADSRQFPSSWLFHYRWTGETKPNHMYASRTELGKALDTEILLYRKEV